ncbi:MAG: hypothetical protein M0Z48_13175 [Nitrospiraceae bacterium]|nr:hypothetical protein [Nitrospiraceae bacterium]
MTFDKRLEKFLIKDDGIKNIFLGIGLISSVAIITNSISDRGMGFFLMLFLMMLALLFGFEKIVEPFTEALFGKKGEYTKITKRWSRKAKLKAANSFQSWVSILLSTAYFMAAVKYLESISIHIK